MTEARYNTAKIYKLVNSVDDRIYVGSTCLILSKRFHMHKSRARNKPGPVHHQLNAIGWDNVRIILIENVTCTSKEELLQREQHFIDLLKPSLNSYSAVGTCPHGRPQNQCVACHGSQICQHNRIKASCVECKGSQICEHNRRKSTCVDCNGSQLCEHKRVKAQCKECNCDKYHCDECNQSFHSNQSVLRHRLTQRHKDAYKRQFLEVFGTEITDDEVPTF
jgi:hypothetical protein